MKSPEDVLEYWFGKLSGPVDFPRDRKKLWWMGGDEVDGEIRDLFGDLVESACAGGLGEWTGSPRSTLALVIVLDQFTRSMYRGGAGAYSGDRRAQAIVLRATEAGQDRELRPIERQFLYMPLMHAEDRELAQRSIEVYESLAREIAETCPEDHPDALSHAQSHADIVLKFGRYPHRNEALGREHTSAEIEYLAGNAPRFGQ